jgi:hypothetical protein
MPSTRSSRRSAAITSRQRRQPRASTREIDALDRRTQPAPLAPEAAAAVAADRAAAIERRTEIRDVIRQVQDRKRQARRDGDLVLLGELKEFEALFEAARRRSGSLDRFPS